jgi:membrane associated rhomboid family serine protease
VRRPYLAWLCVAALLAACALAGSMVPHEALDWQPGLVFSQPWRALTPIGVHYSQAHLIGNLAGVALAGVFGIAALAPARLAGAWLAAWPLTHLGLLCRPELRHYGGLSGVVHAGVAAIVVWVLANGRTRAQRGVGALVAIGFVAKLLSESPWGTLLRHPAGWDIAVAPFVHLTGAVSGVLCALVALYFQRRAERLSA